MLEEIKKLSWQQTIGSVFCFVGVISPGFLIIYLYKPELVSTLETVKLAIFSLSLSLPIFLTNMVALSGIESSLRKQNRHFELAALAMFCAFLGSYPVILAAYIANLPFQIFLLALFVWHFPVWALWARFRSKSRSSKNA